MPLSSIAPLSKRTKQETENTAIKPYNQGPTRSLAVYGRFPAGKYKGSSLFQFCWRYSGHAPLLHEQFSPGIKVLYPEDTSWADKRREEITAKYQTRIESKECSPRGKD